MVVIFILWHRNTKHNENISVKQKPNKNRDQRGAVRIKFRDPLQYKLGFRQSFINVVERLCWQLGRTLVAVAVVERLKFYTMYGLSAGMKKVGRCRVVAVSEGCTV